MEAQETRDLITCAKSEGHGKYFRLTKLIINFIILHLPCRFFLLFHIIENIIFTNHFLSENFSTPKLSDPYSSDLNWVKQNHPLMIMASRKRFRLLNHPAVLAVIRHKWSVGRMFYFLFLLYYAAFLTFVTAFMVAATPPYLIQMPGYV